MCLVNSKVASLQKIEKTKKIWRCECGAYPICNGTILASAWVCEKCSYNVLGFLVMDMYRSFLWKISPKPFENSQREGLPLSPTTPTKMSDA